MKGSFELSYAGVPFIGDQSRELQTLSGSPLPCESLYDRLDRLIPFHRVEDVYNSLENTGRNTGHLARQLQTSTGTEQTCKIGEWYYPVGAVRYSIFRGLATSSQMKAMLAATQGRAATFAMKCEPDSPYKSYLGYELSSPMYMLPPRPLAEHGGAYDGVYLITLVDERFNWRGVPFTPWPLSTWEALLDSLAETLGITLTYSTIDSVYGDPDPDSQWWTDYEDAALLLDAAAYNVGRSVVRKLNGTYALMTPEETRASVVAARRAPVTRLAGGDIYASGQTLKGGNLNPSKNSVCPENITVTFPKYVQGFDPVPHYYNPRTDTTWFQDSYGEVYSVNVPIKSGGIFASGLSGNGTLTFHDTCKAIYSSEEGAVNSEPTNNTELTALAMRLAGDYYGTQAAAALDEVFPGTVAWPPDGLHDVVWTYSERAKVASCRVMKTEWSAYVKNYQHRTDDTDDMPGGPLVAQVMRDDRTGYVHTVNLTTFDAPLRVDEGVRTSGGVIEAVVNLGTNGQPYGGGTVNNPGGGYGGTVYFENTTFSYLGGGGGGGSSTFNTLNFFGTNIINYGSSSSSSTESTTINVYGGTTQYFYSGSTTSYEDNSSLVVNVTEGANLTIINYPTDPNNTTVGCPKFYSVYQHVDTPLVTEGQTLTPGQQIATLAAIATGSHLHFALGDSYTPPTFTGNTLLSGTWSFVGTTIDLNPGNVWFPSIGTRVAGGAGPSAPTLTAKQIAWIRQRLRRPIDNTGYWVQHFGSEFHVGRDYHAIDCHTSPISTPNQDAGRPVYQMANSSEIVSRVVYVSDRDPDKGYGIVVQHERVSDACPITPLTPKGTPTLPPEVSYESETTIFIQNWSFTSLTFVDLTFVNLNVSFDETTVVTFNGQFNLCTWWWWCYEDTTITSGKIPRIDKTITRITDVLSGTTIREFDRPRTGERRTIINTTSGYMTIENTIATASGLSPGLSGFIAEGEAIQTPRNVPMTWGPGETIETWYDPVTKATRILSITGAGGSDAYTVKATSGDTTAGFLADKLVAGSNISLTLNNSGANESYTIAATTGGGGGATGSGTYLNSNVPVYSSGYADLGLTVTLPGSGIYAVHATLDSSLEGTQHDRIVYQLYDSTSSTMLSPNGRHELQATPLAQAVGLTVHIHSLLSVTSGHSVTVRGAILTGAGPANLLSGSLLSYVKVA